MKQKPATSTEQYNLDDDCGTPGADLAHAESDEGCYSIEDDDEVDEYDDEYNNEEEEEADDSGDENATARRRNPAPWRLLLDMMINPVEGWKAIRRSRLSVEKVSSGCFYPLIATAALSSFLECFWKSSINLNQATVDALKIFVSFFFGNYLILMLIRLTFPETKKEIADSAYCKEYVIFNLSTLALFYILYELLPMVGPVLVFLPIWTIYLALRGARFFMLPQEKANLLKTLLCIFIVGAPSAIYWIMDTLL